MEITNKFIAKQFSLLAKLMELHGENLFKIRSYQKAYQLFRKYPNPLHLMSLTELQSIEGVGKAIADKVVTISKTSKLPQLQPYLDKTPSGIIELLNLRGVGPKKIKLLWNELGIESAGELWYACEENRLVSIKGFGEKTQKNIQDQIDYFLKSRGKIRLDQAEEIANSWERYSEENGWTGKWIYAGEYLRKCQVIEQFVILVLPEMIDDIIKIMDGEKRDNYYKIEIDGYGINVYVVENLAEVWDYLEMDVPEGFKRQFQDITNAPFEIIEVYREYKEDIDQLIKNEDIKGLVHCHTDWSDGGASLEAMVAAAEDKGYEYITITDHSKSAFYANGLNEERLLKQIEQIRNLDQKTSIKVLAGSEVDIKSDGSMDYDIDLLSQLDVVIASVHSQLKMDESKAMHRLLKAIEHPEVNILGHLTGRLLLTRPGYPIDHKRIIDACAMHGVSIELNANPQRLDMDAKWIKYCMQKGVMISINPDAHSVIGMDDVKYGVYAARKGGLTKDMCLNALDSSAFLKQIQS